MVGILIASILAAVLMDILLRVVDGRFRQNEEATDGNAVDGAARREVQQRGLHGLGSGARRWLRRGKVDRK
jgi:type II secretory pathway pseudopilin PulG